MIDISKYSFNYLPPLTKEQEKSPFADFYYLKVPDPDKMILDSCVNSPINPDQALSYDSLRELFLPDGLPVENGWCICENGTGFSIVTTRMKNVTEDMEKWWNEWFMSPEYGGLNYKIWMPGLHFIHSMPIMEDHGWGLMEVIIDRIIEPEMLETRENPASLDSDFIKCLITSGSYRKVADGSNKYRNNVEIQCYKKYEDGLKIHTLNFDGVKWEDGRFIKVHDADSEIVQYHMLHNAYEYNRMGMLLPEIYGMMHRRINSFC